VSNFKGTCHSKQGVIDKDQKYLNEELYQKLKKDFEPKVREILLTKDATPGTAYLLEEPIEGIIADLVCQSHKTRKKAKELLEEAKQKIEKLIEK